MFVYTVRPGDTLGGIASYYGTSVEALVRENRIPNPDLIFVGQKLRMPGVAQAAPPHRPLPPPEPGVRGAIAEKYRQLGGEKGFLGRPLTSEKTTPDRVGRFNHFEGGSIYWTSETGAHEVHGVIRDAWAETGWERGRLGYPVSDEYGVPGGRRSDFEHGSLRWDAKTGKMALITKARPPIAGGDVGGEGGVGITNPDYRLPVAAPVRGDPKARNRETYDRVIDQFAVETNPRYRPRENDTYCNIFVWDVTRAMRAEIPHWVGADGRPLEPKLTRDRGWIIADDHRWLSANDNHVWLNRHGRRYGYREVSAGEAQALANRGHPTVASVYNPTGPGHIGIVRPGEILNGPALAQAGLRNLNHAHVYDIFPIEGTQFFCNDAGRCR